MRNPGILRQMMYKEKYNKFNYRVRDACVQATTI